MLRSAPRRGERITPPAASKKEEDGSLWVQENNGHWFPFEEFSTKWTFEHMHSRVKK